MHPFLDVPAPLAIAHRGGDHPAGCENTMAAFAHAVAFGYRYLETDVRCTADGVLVCLHDADLARVAGVADEIAALPWSTVRDVRVGGSEPIPRFDELLDAFPDARIVVDAKSDDAVEPLLASIRAQRATARVCVGSFSDERLARVRAGLGPDGCTSMGPREVAALRVASWRLRPPRSVPRAAACVQVPLRHRGIPVADRRFVMSAQRLDLPVHVWTVNEPSTIGALLDLGVDGVISDAVATLREVLSARGAWAA